MLRASFLVMIFVACGSKESADSGRGTGSVAQKSQAPGGTGSATQKSAESDGRTVAADQMGTFTCKDLQNDACLGAVDRFEATVPVVHVTYKTTELPKPGDVYVIQWIAEDVGQAAPPNSVIATLDKPVTEVVTGTTNYVVNSKLTKPTNGWPIGKYRVEVKRGDKLETTARFTIQ